MNNAAANRDAARHDAKILLHRVGIGRILMVDDEYAPGVGDLLGICEELGSARTAALPHLERIRPEDPDEVRTNAIRDAWDGLDRRQRRELLAKAEEARDVEAEPRAENEAEKNVETGTDSKPDDDPGADDESRPHDDPAAGDDGRPGDDRAASSLDALLADLEGVEFVPLSLSEWEEQQENYLGDGRQAETLVLFDRDFSGEGGDEDEGLKRIQVLQEKKIGFLGLVTHTVALGEEYEEWERLSEKHSLKRHKFVVIAKDRLKAEPPNYHGFLAMVRLTALNDQYGRVKNDAWKIFANSVDEAKSRMGRLSVLDFDRMVFASSRDESVWEPDTLLRIFSILVRREALSRLHASDEFVSEVEKARAISDAPKRVVNELKKEKVSDEALEVQRCEIYDVGSELNQFRVPIDLGDIFCIGPENKLFMLLAQPCDLVVRKDGTRNREKSNLRRTAAIAELERGGNDKRESCGRLPFYEEASGKTAFVNFAKVHQVPLAVLDLCVLSDDGSARIDLEAPASRMLVEPWRARHKWLKKVFDTALKTHQNLTKSGADADAALVALPGWWSTQPLNPAVAEKTVRYAVQRTIRLRQPWSGALLTEFAQYQARAAFEHYFVGESAEAASETNDDANAGEQETG